MIHPNSTLISLSLFVYDWKFIEELYLVSILITIELLNNHILTALPQNPKCLYKCIVTPGMYTTSPYAFILSLGHGYGCTNLASEHLLLQRDRELAYLEIRSLWEL